ncbi:MAG: insulinase family protein [Nocardioidaceae bacterium]|nr:insulinase family protein [Nocardioidaceae bacterium]
MAHLPATEQPLGSTRTLLKEHGEGANGGAVGSVVRRTVLPGGLRVVTEAMPGARSAALGLWTGIGSRDESRSLDGATHFLEHLLFKGTGRRTALDISSQLDAVGGELNAFTGKEFTCYHARVLDADMPLAIDVLCDMVTSSLIPANEVESERSVILEEIAMHDDDPDDVVHNAFVSAMYGDSALGRSITGSVGSIKALTRRQIFGYYRRRYTADNLVFTAAGNVNHATVVRLVRRAFERADALGEPSRGPAPVRTSSSAAHTSGGTALVKRPTELASFVLGTPAYPRNDSRRFALGVLNGVIGGGTSSRLFQEVRERRGLAYTIYSFTSQYVDSGYFAVAGGCMPDKIRDVLGICSDELAKASSAGITLEELERGKGQLRGTLVMGLEDAGARMTRIGKAELVPGGLMSIDESLAHIDAVTLDDVHEVAQQVLTPRPTLAVLGPATALTRATRTTRTTR